MESMQDKIVNFYLNYQVPLLTLSLIGLYAYIWWAYENFKSILQIVKALLSPYFLPNENKSLSEKYGKWAGKIVSSLLHPLFHSQKAINFWKIYNKIFQNLTKVLILQYTDHHFVILRFT